MIVKWTYPIFIPCLLFFGSCSDLGTGRDVPEPLPPVFEWSEVATFEPGYISNIQVHQSGVMFGTGWRTDEVGLYRSLDSGSTWQLVRSAYVYSYFVSPDGNTVITASSGPLYNYVHVSRDRGNTWQEASIHGSLGDCAFLEDGRIIAGFGINPHSSGGIRFSDDFGESWTWELDLRDVSVVGIAELDPDTLMLLGYRAPSLDGIFYYSYDKGVTWERDTSTSEIPFPYDFIWIRSSRALFVGLPSVGLLRKKGGFGSWDTIGFSNQRVYSLSLTTDGIMALATTRYQESVPQPPPFYLSVDHGNTWIPVYDKILPRPISSLAIDNSGQLFVGGQRLLRTKHSIVQSLSLSGTLPNRSLN